jgi:serine/threonine-protein kinase
MRRRPQHWLPAWARRLPPMAVGVFVAVTAAAISVAVTCAVSGSHAPISGRPLAAQSLARPDQSSPNDPAAGLVARPAPRGTDLKGFVGYPGARCNSANPAVAIGRTFASLIVICQSYDGRFYYKRLGLQNGLSVELQNFVRIDDTFGASNNGVQYEVSPVALIIKEGQATVSAEPMLEYWSV